MGGITREHKTDMHVFQWLACAVSNFNFAANADGRGTSANGFGATDIGSAYTEISALTKQGNAFGFGGVSTQVTNTRNQPNFKGEST